MTRRLVLLLMGVSVAAAQTASIRVDPTHVENQVSPRMYAAFMEMMAEDVKWGLTAEMVHDRSFEEPPNYLGLPARWNLEPDERNDNVGAIKFAPVTEEAYPKTNRATGSAEHSLEVTVTRKDISDVRIGFSQGRISIRAGQRYDGYVWMNVPERQGFAGKITAALEEDNTDGATYAKESLPVIATAGWKQFRFILMPEKTDRFAKLSFLFAGAGKLYMDEVSLEPSNAKDQVRPDVEAMIAKLRPSFLRWPGGNVAQDYHWEWGVGPRDQRPVWTKHFMVERAGAGRLRDGRVSGIVRAAAHGTLDHGECERRNGNAGRSSALGGVCERPGEFDVWSEARG